MRWNDNDHYSYDDEDYDNDDHDGCGDYDDTYDDDIYTKTF